MNLPEYPNIRLREMPNGKREVLDILRHRFVALTPEEWVRQHFVNFLITQRGYPSALMGNEVEIVVGEKRLRCDTVLYDRHGQPRMIMEYKAECVPISDKVLTQVSTYNMILHVDYLIASNGNTHICLHFVHGDNRWEQLMDIPLYTDLD